MGNGVIDPSKRKQMPGYDPTKDPKSPDYVPPPSSPPVTDHGTIDSGGNVQPKVVTPPSSPPSEMSPAAQALERDYERRMKLKQQGK